MSRTELPDRLLAGRYELESPLGEGGMALVARARDRQTGKACAVKVLLPHVASRRSIRARFAAEARVMVKLAHPHIVQVLDVGEHNGVPFLVMELLPGGSLQTWLESEGAMPARQAVEVMIDLCRAVEHAHAHGVIHRDIKPHNVLLTSSGLPKLSDFGIARTDEGKTKTGAAMGTLGYVAPEQLADAKSATAAADVYSLGVTLWKLVTDGRVERLAYNMGRGALDALPEALLPTVEAALAQDEEERTATVAAFRQQLESVVDQLPTAKKVSLVHEPAREHEDVDDLWDAFSNTMDGLLTEPSQDLPPDPGWVEPVVPYMVGLTDEDRQATDEAREARLARSSAPTGAPDIAELPASTQVRSRRASSIALAVVVVLSVTGALGLVFGAVGTAATYGPELVQQQQAESARRFADDAAVAEVLESAPYAIAALPDPVRSEVEPSYRAIVEAEPAQRRTRAMDFVNQVESELLATLPEDPARWTDAQRAQVERVERMKQAVEVQGPR